MSVYFNVTHIVKVIIGLEVFYMKEATKGRKMYVESLQDKHIVNR